MALRNIRIKGDPILEKKCKTVKELTPSVKILIEDMLDTMYDADGVGLAGPQVGVLKKIFVIDIGEGPLVFINPEILETEGTQQGDEGCLSDPGKCALVERPMKVRVRAFNENMEEFELEGEGLLARAICHENDHLYGQLYTDIAIGPVKDMTEPDIEDMEGMPEIHV